MLNKKELIEILSLPKLDQLTQMYKLFDDFIKFHHRPLIRENKLSPFRQRSQDYYNLKLSIRFENKFRLFLNIFDEILKTNQSEIVISKQYVIH